MNPGYVPVGGWPAVTGIFNIPPGVSEIAMLLLLFAVMFWVAGFDIIMWVALSKAIKKYLRENTISEDE